MNPPVAFALTLKAPWAEMMMDYGKDVENRPWPATRYVKLGTRIAIHAGQGYDRSGALWLMHDLSITPRLTYPRGVIVGTVRLVDVVEASASRWFDGPYGWVVEDHIKFHDPIPASGALGLWRLTPSQQAQVAQAEATARSGIILPPPLIVVDELQDHPLSAVAPAARRHGTRWCHLMAEDDNIPALVAFAQKLGLRSQWLQGVSAGHPHFDLVPSKRAMAVKLGAKEVNIMEWMRERKARRCAQAVTTEEVEG